jgi:hypothetical protein
MTDNKEDSKEPEIIVGAEEASTEPQETPVTEKPKRHLGPWLLLIVATAIVFVWFTPQQFISQTTKDEYLNPVVSWVKNIQEKFTQTEKAPAPVTPAPQIEVQPAPVEEVVTALNIEPELPPVPEVKTASSEEIERALDAMRALQSELQSIRQQQRAMQESQRSVQRMQLRTRLHWVTNPANHLPQLQLAWEEISLIPTLSSGERQQARAMLALAEKRLQQLQGWQQTLRTHAESLSSVEHDNIIPEFENRWLSWIGEQFSVRPSLSKEEARDAQLREQLINTSRNIEIEQWPDTNAWLQLRATLQLKLIATEKGDASPVTELGLPESFDAIKHDIEQLRQAASTWLERLS